MEKAIMAIFENGTTVLALLFAIAAGICTWRDSRQMRNGALLVIAIGFAVLTILKEDNAGWVIFLLALVAIAALPAFGVLLIINGLVMLRREGRTTATLVSLGLGALSLSSPYLFGIARAIGIPLWTILSILVIVAYIAASFFAFLLYSLFYPLFRSRLVPDHVVVLGSGLINGKVAPLLAGRPEKAIQIYRAAPAKMKPVLIPSGGQGPDEPISEGKAMEEYLLESGIPQASIIAEVRSRTTLENIEYSRLLMEGRNPSIAIATSSYHSFHAAMYSRCAGIKANVVGAKRQDASSLVHI